MSQDTNNLQTDKEPLNKEVLENALLATLYRKDCPDPMILGEYQLGLLVATEQAQIEAHLTNCPHCQAELSRLGDFLDGEVALPRPTEVAPPQDWIKGEGFLWRQLAGAKQIIIRLLDDVLTSAAQNISRTLSPPPGQLAYGGKWRLGEGENNLVQVELKEGVEDLEVIVVVQEKVNDARHCTITVDVNIPSRGGWPNLGNTEVTLRKEGMELRTRLTDAFGKAIFEDILRDELFDLDLEIVPAP